MRTRRGKQQADAEMIDEEGAGDAEASDRHKILSKELELLFTTNDIGAEEVRDVGGSKMILSMVSDSDSDDEDGDQTPPPKSPSTVKSPALAA